MYEDRKVAEWVDRKYAGRSANFKTGVVRYYLGKPYAYPDYMLQFHDRLCAVMGFQQAYVDTVINAIERNSDLEDLQRSLEILQRHVFNVRGRLPKEVLYSAPGIPSHSSLMGTYRK